MTVPNEPVGSGQGPDTGLVPDTAPATQEPTGNPWDNDLQKLPESVRPLVEPIFREWDGNVTKRLQSVHSEYEPYKPFVEAYEPDAIAQAIGLAQALEEDPQKFLAALQEAFGTPEQGATGQPQAVAQPQEPAAPVEPWQEQLSQHQQLLEVIAQNMLAERQAQEQAAEDAELDSLLTELHTKHGAFDDNYVISLIANDVEPEAAVAQFKSIVEGYAQQLNAPNATAPTVVGSAGAGLPAERPNPSALSSKDTKALVAQMLAQAAAERNQ